MLFTAHTDKVNCRDITKNYYQDTDANNHLIIKALMTLL